MWLFSPTTGPRSAVGIMYDCRSRGHEFNPGRSHTFMVIDHEIISMAILLLSAESRRVVVIVTSESMCMKYWLTA